MGADLSSAAIIRELELEPHPEGGFYHQTFRDKAGGERGHSTAIYYLLEKGTRSHWHRVTDAVEVWHYYAGAPITLHLSEDGRGGTDLYPRPRHSGRRAPAGDRACQLLAIGRKPRRLHPRRLHRLAGFRLFKLRDGRTRMVAGRYAITASTAIFGGGDVDLAYPRRNDGVDRGIDIHIVGFGEPDLHGN